MISNPMLNQEQLQAVLQHIRDLFSQCQTLHRQTMERQERVENMLRRVRQLRARREALEQEDARYDMIRRGYRTDDPKEIPHSPESAVSPSPSLPTHLIGRSPPQSQRHLPDSTPPPRRQLPEYMRNARVQRTPPEDRGTDSEPSDHEPSEGQALGEMAMREPVDQPPVRLVLRRAGSGQIVSSSVALRSPSMTRRRGGIAFGPIAVDYTQLDTYIFVQNAQARYAPERVRQEFCLERERLDDGDCIIYKVKFGETCVLLMGFDWVPFENAHRMEPPWLEHVGTSLPYISADRAAGLRFLDQDRMDCIVWLELEIAVREERTKEDLAEVLWNTWIDEPWSTARTQTTAPFMFENEDDEVDISSVAFVTDM